MPTFFRLMEVFYCAMADFIPYLLLVVYPFRNHLRLKNFLAGFLAVLIGPALFYYTVTSALGTSPIDLPFPLMRSAVLLVFGLLVIRANIGKHLLNTLLAEACGKTVEEVAVDTDRDHYMNATQALAYGIIDTVVTSKKTA